jgi:hypothetical protein
LNDEATTRRHDVGCAFGANTKATKITKATKSGLNISGFPADADVGPGRRWQE